jgi:hypothetical protein
LGGVVVHSGGHGFVDGALHGVGNLGGDFPRGVVVLVFGGLELVEVLAELGGVLCEVKEGLRSRRGTSQLVTMPENQ